MRDPNRIPIVLGKLQTVWESMPDLRLTQLLINMIGYKWAKDPFHLEDDKLEEMLDEYTERVNNDKYKRRETE